MISVKKVSDYPQAMNCRFVPERVQKAFLLATALTREAGVAECVQAVIVPKKFADGPSAHFRAEPIVSLWGAAPEALRESVKWVVRQLEVSDSDVFRVNISELGESGFTVSP